MSSKDNNQTKKESGLSTAAKVVIGVATGAATLGGGGYGVSCAVAYSNGKEMQQQQIPVNETQKNMDSFQGLPMK